MKILIELAQIIKEMDELNCLRCGKELKTKEDFQTGICADCWDPDVDGDVDVDEDCQYTECYVDEDDNILSEGAVRMFKRVGKKIIRKYRCTSGPKKGKPVSDPSKCATRIDPKKSREGRKRMRRGKATRKRKSKITKRTTISKMVSRLNKSLSKKGKKPTTLSKKTTLKPSSTKFTKVTNASTSTVKTKGLLKAKKTK